MIRIPFVFRPPPAVAWALSMIILLGVAGWSLVQTSVALGPVAEWPLLPVQAFVGTLGLLLITVGPGAMIRSTVLVFAGLGLASLVFRMTVHGIGTPPDSEMLVWIVWLIAWSTSMSLGARWWKRTEMPFVLGLVAVPLVWLISDAAYGGIGPALPAYGGLATAITAFWIVQARQRWSR